MPTIVGIDLALVNTGIVTVIRRDDGTLTAVAATIVKTAPAPKRDNIYKSSDYIRRASELYKGMLAELREMHPALVAVEVPSGSQRAKVSMGNGIVTGVIAAVAEVFPDVPFVWLQQHQVKRALLSRQKVSKEEMAVAVLARIPDLDEHLQRVARTKREHLADAAAAILTAEGCEAWRAVLRTEVTIEWQDHPESPGKCDGNEQMTL